MTGKFVYEWGGGEEKKPPNVYNGLRVRDAWRPREENVSGAQSSSPQNDTENDE